MSVRRNLALRVVTSRLVVLLTQHRRSRPPCLFPYVMVVADAVPRSLPPANFRSAVLAGSIDPPDFLGADVHRLPDSFSGSWGLYGRSAYSTRAGFVEVNKDCPRQQTYPHSPSLFVCPGAVGIHLSLVPARCWER